MTNSDAGIMVPLPARERNKLDVHHSSENPNWRTPPEAYEDWDIKLHFQVDACASPDDHLAPVYFSADGINALTARWEDYGRRFFMNSPYGRTERVCEKNCKKKACQKRGYHLTEERPGIDQFIKKAYESSVQGALVLALIPARTDTDYWHRYVMKARGIYFVEGRIPFLLPTGATDPAPFPNAFVLWDGSLGSHFTRRAPWIDSWNYRAALARYKERHKDDNPDSGHGDHSQPGEPIAVL